jgi:hypothetical protein
MTRGLFKPTVMFFGLCNSPATFQGFIDDAFKEEINSEDYGIYMDDILITTNGTLEHHIKGIHHIFDKIKDNYLFLKLEKCMFHKKEINYLGLIIGNGTVHMDHTKVEGITKWLIPTMVKQVRSFLGFCNFYHAFIPKFSNIAQPLNDLTKKNYQWCWETNQQDAFE